ncbi:response regulator [Halobellus salinisoli]|uniref:response regulator n=1 Tax=Halobellus salinisoli TaxID=3108500 RepID=UPI003008023F
MSALPHVLIVDDEPDLAELYASWLDDEYAVETAHNGATALERFDQPADVALLDRRMPGMSGDEVLERIRERDPECSVAMITAVDPDFDILELGFDAYLTKPVGETGLKNVVDRLLRRSEYTDTLQTFFAKLSKREALMAKKPQFELEADERYQRLESEIETLRKESEAHLSELDGEDFEALFYRLDA